MIVSFRCPCGQVNRVVGLSADGLADCPACRRTVVVAGLSQPRGLWIALAAVGFFVAVLLGSIIAFVIMSNGKSSTNLPIARATNDELKPVANVTVPTAPATRATQPTKPESAPIPKPEPPEIIAPLPESPAVPLPREGVLKPTLIEPAGRYKLGETFGQVSSSQGVRLSACSATISARVLNTHSVRGLPFQK